MAAWAILAVAEVSLPRPSGAEPRPTVPLGCLAVPGAANAGCHDAGALAHLAWECRRRTSIATELRPLAVPWREAALYAQPMVIWQGSGPIPAVPQAAVDLLAGWLGRGGMLLVDAADPEGSQARAAFLAGVDEVLAQGLGKAAVDVVPKEHVLYRSFYLLRGIGEQRPLARAIRLSGKLAVVFSGEPWLSTIAAEAGVGADQLASEVGGAEREQVLRMAINWLMYALCLDYKDDQVHLPYLLERRSP